MGSKVSSRVLVIDDEPEICDFVEEVAEDMGFDVFTTSVSTEFPTTYSNAFVCVIMDLSMPGMDGIEIIRFMADQGSRSKLILMSGFDLGILTMAEKLAKDRGLEVLGALGKPIVPEDLEALLANVHAASSEPEESMPPLPIEGSKEFPSVEELRAAINNKEIRAYFQPRVRVSDNSLAGVEALARWAHPHKGMIPPSIFIPLAEENELIDDLTGVMLEQAMENIVAWNKAGLIIEVSVNFSAKSLCQLDLPDKLAQNVQEHGVNPSQIVVEITESSVVGDLQNSLDVLTRLRMKGFQISIDDFGTGFSSMQQFQNLPFNELKIDQSFVMQALKNKDSRVIVETTNDFGMKLGMKVVAEGVEDQETWDLITQIGCDQIQGFFMARPMPGSDILDWHQNTLIKAST